MPIETHLHHDPLWSLIVVFGVNLALPLLVVLAFVIAASRREGDDRRTYLGVARLSLTVCVIMQLFTAGYYARLLAGTHEEGTVTQRESIVESRYPRCELTLDTPHGSLEIAVPQGQCRALLPGTPVPIITVASSTMFAQVGEAPTANALLTLGLIPLMFLLITTVVVRAAASR